MLKSVCLLWCQNPTWVEEAKLSKPKYKSGACLEEPVSAACSRAIYSVFLRKLTSCVPAAGRDILDLVTRLMWTHDLIYVGVSVSVRRDPQRCLREAGSADSGTGWCHFDREQRGPCWCQRGARHSDKPRSSSSPPPAAVSLLMTLPRKSRPLTISLLYIWVINTHAPNR